MRKKTLDEVIADQIRHRDYTELEYRVGKLIKRSGFSATKKRILSAVAKRNKTPSYVLWSSRWIKDGDIRDAFLRLLGLGSIPGIEVDPIEMSKGIRAQSMDELRSELLPLAKKILEDQIGRGNTFFIDVDELSGTPFEYLKESIAETRREQLTSLPSTISLSKAVGTYEGFKILTRNQVNQFMTPEERRGAVLPFEKLCADAGNRVIVEGKRFGFKGVIWEYCPQPIREILRNLLRAYTSGYKKAKVAYYWLTEFRDIRISRELRGLQGFVNEPRTKYGTRKHRYPRKKSTSYPTLVIPVSQYKEHLLMMAKEGYNSYFSHEYFWFKCERRSVLQFLEKALAREDPKIRHAAVRALLGFDYHGIRVLEPHRDIVLEALCYSNSGTHLLNLAIPLFGKRTSDVREVIKEERKVFGYALPHQNIGKESISQNQDKGEVMVL